MKRLGFGQVFFDKKRVPSCLRTFGPLKTLGLSCFALRPRVFCAIKVKKSCSNSQVCSHSFFDFMALFISWAFPYI